MDELKELLLTWPHWAFEIISGGVFFVFGILYSAVVPPDWNPVTRWLNNKLKKHDEEVHSDDHPSPQRDEPH